jgi:hypothetical protein
MRKVFRSPFFHFLTGMIFLICSMSVLLGAQDLEKEYAPILGDYEFDMTDFGWGMVTVKVYVENDALWSWPDNSDSPGEMIPVEGEGFVFTIDAGEQGIYKLEFLKDESGEYSKCHATNETLDIDITGEKIIL